MLALVLLCTCERGVFHTVSAARPSCRANAARRAGSRPRALSPRPVWARRHGGQGRYTATAVRGGAAARRPRPARGVCGFYPCARRDRPERLPSRGTC